MGEEQTYWVKNDNDCQTLINLLLTSCFANRRVTSHDGWKSSLLITSEIRREECYCCASGLAISVINFLATADSYFL